MRSLKFNTNSLHYKIANIGGYYRHYDTDDNEVTDICYYTKKVMIGLFIITIMTALIGVVCWLLINFSFGVIFSIWTGSWLMNPAGEAVLIMSSILITSAILYFGIGKLGQWVRGKIEDSKDKPDGFVHNAYKSWKEKFCAKITFTDS